MYEKVVVLGFLLYGIEESCSSAFEGVSWTIVSFVRVKCVAPYDDAA